MATLGKIHRTRIAGKKSGFAHGEGSPVTWDLGLTQLASIEFDQYWSNMQDTEDADSEDEASLKAVFIDGFKDGFANARGTFIDITNAATIADCNASTLRYAIKRGDLPATKLGGNWVVIYSELKAWIDAPEMHKTGAKKPNA